MYWGFGLWDYQTLCKTLIWFERVVSNTSNHIFADVEATTSIEVKDQEDFEEVEFRKLFRNHICMQQVKEINIAGG